MCTTRINDSEEKHYTTLQLSDVQELILLLEYLKSEPIGLYCFLMPLFPATSVI